MKFVRYMAASLLSLPLFLTSCSSTTSSGAASGPNYTFSFIDTNLNYQLKNVNSGLVLDISGNPQAAGGVAVQNTASSAASQLWHLVPSVTGQYSIVNANSGQALGINFALKTAGATALQYADNGTNDHYWTAVYQTTTQIKFQNFNSGLVLGITGASTSAGAVAIQVADDGSTMTQWTLVPQGAAYPNPTAISGNTNPIPDPSIVKAGSTYYTYATGGPITMHTSSDRVNFSLTGTALPLQPTWAKAYNGVGDLWAPDVSFHNGKYYLYFAASSFGSQKSGIGMATSPTGAPGTFVDSGGPILTTASCSTNGTNINAIDPGLLVDASGNWWLSYGSFLGGISMVQLNSATGLPLSPTPTCYPLANRVGSIAIEGTYVYQHAGYYYLFASLDYCCRGDSSTYHITVGRSANPNGPFVDRGGVAMTAGGGTIVLATHGNVVGPGGLSLFGDTDGDVLVYHYYDGGNNGAITLAYNLLNWSSDGWPSVR